MKKAYLLGLFVALMATSSLHATLLLNQGPVSWTGNQTTPTVSYTLSQNMTKNETYYVQYTVALTSSVPPWTGSPQDPNNRNSNYPYVAQNNASYGGAGFAFFIGEGYNSDYLASTGFTTSTWNTNQFSATNGGNDARTNRTSTGMVAQYSTPVTPGFPTSGPVKYKVDLTLRMGSQNYDYKVTKLDGSGNVIGVPVTLANLAFGSGNAWNNFYKFENKISFQSSTTQMTANFDSIIVSTTPIPEPGTFVLVGLGTALVCFSRRRRNG